MIGIEQAIAVPVGNHYLVRGDLIINNPKRTVTICEDLIVEGNLYIEAANIYIFSRVKALGKKGISLFAHEKLTTQGSLQASSISVKAAAEKSFFSQLFETN